MGRGRLGQVCVFLQQIKGKDKVINGKQEQRHMSGKGSRAIKRGEFSKNATMFSGGGS